MVCISWYTLGVSQASIVAVFGSSCPCEGMPSYSAARELGVLLAEAGYIVATGGYGGVMEAASRGASEAGGHVIGVTCERIEALVPGLVANRWVAEEIRFGDLRTRLNHLVIGTQAAIAMPGGIGTLSEIALSWSLLQITEIPPQPLILVGESWKHIVSVFLQQAGDYVQEGDKGLMRMVDTPLEATKIVTGYL